MGALSYPPAIESFWAREAHAALGARDEEDLIEKARPFVQALSDRFTIARERAPEPYSDDPAARAAYGLFFFPQTFARAQCVLAECGWPPPAAPSLNILDLGAGTGAASFAALAMLGARPARLAAIDRSASALDTLGRLFAECRALWPGAALETCCGELSDVSGPSDESDKSDFQLILCSFALNELAEQDPAFDPGQWLRRQIRRLAPGGMIALIEPALKSCAERIEVLRDRVAAEGWGRIVAPCPHHAPCPMRAEGRFWCHEVRRWAPPPLAERINRRMFRDLPHLKFSFLAIRRDPTMENSGWARLVAPVTEQRGKFITRACCPDGRLRELELLTRALDADSRAALRRMERGTRIAFEPDRELAGGILRVRTLRPVEPSD